MTPNPIHPVIETLELTKVFTDFWGRPRVTALRSLSLSVHPGEVFGLLGPNGSGKTTTIQILLGLLFPTRGQALVFGRSPRDVRIKARIGYLPEESYLYPFLDAEETLDFYGRLFLLEGSERRRRTDSLLELVGLGVERHRPLREYSKGMARRIGIAQALINDPDLLILDEPTSGLDPIGNREVKDLILRLKQRGKTILLSSHLLADVEDVCDRIAILYGGQIRKEGRVHDLLTQAQVTQISAEGLSDPTVQKVVDLIRADKGEIPVAVDHPRTRLEALFLQVVQEAQAARTETAGARLGQAQQDFLASPAPANPPGSQVLSRLLPSAPETAARPEPASAHPPEPGKAVLARLAPPETTAPEPPPAQEQSPRGPPAAKPAVLDRLLKPESPGEPGSKPGGGSA